MIEYKISSLSTGLTKLVDRIEDLVPQDPPHARTEGKEIEHIRKTVLRYKWSDAAVRSIVSSNYTFNGFVTELHEGIQVENEMSLLTSETRTAESDTLFQRYGCNPRYVQKYGPSQAHRQNAVPTDSAVALSRKAVSEMSVTNLVPKGVVGTDAPLGQYAAMLVFSSRTRNRQCTSSRISF